MSEPQLDESRKLSAEKYLAALEQLIEDLPDPLPLSDSARAELRRQVIVRRVHNEEVQRARAEFGFLPMGTETPFVLTMSGGGHRAALFGLGGLMAIVDAGANSRVGQIASVSGGSITNLVVAEGCDFQSVSSAEFANVAKGLFETTTRGILTKFVLGILIAVIIGPIVAFVAASLARQLPSIPVLLGATLVWLSVISLRGLVIEWLMKRRYFRGGRTRLRLGSLAASQKRAAEDTRKGVDHVVCCTDLVSGKPIYFSTCNGGKGYGLIEREMEAMEPPVRNASEASVAAILRASAGFPGIPPRRFRVVGGTWLTSLLPVRPSGDVAFLSDGGIWNNLGTQAYVEGRFYRGSERQTFLDPMVVLSLDASAELERHRGWDLQLPGWAEIQALLRQVTILTTNTVEPRRETFRDRFRLAIQRGDLLGISQPGGAYYMGVDYEPRVILVSLQDSPPGIAADLNRQLSSIEADLTDLATLVPRLSELAYRDPVDVSSLWDVSRTLSSRWNPWNRILQLLNCPAYTEACSIAGVPDQTGVDPTCSGTPRDQLSSDLGDEHRLLLQLERIAEDLLYSQDLLCRSGQLRQVPTTLGAVDRFTARRLVGRGYANAAVTLFMLGLTDTLPSPTEHHSWLFRD